MVPASSSTIVATALTLRAHPCQAQPQDYTRPFSSGTITTTPGGYPPHESTCVRRRHVDDAGRPRSPSAAQLGRRHRPPRNITSRLTHAMTTRAERIDGPRRSVLDQLNNRTWNVSHDVAATAILRDSRYPCYTVFPGPHGSRGSPQPRGRRLCDLQGRLLRDR